MLNHNELDKLLAINEKYSVSLYIPTVITGDYEGNRIRWQNAINAAEKQLEKKGAYPRDIDSILKPANDLLSDPDFWAHQSKGLAGFYSPSTNKHVHMSYSPEDFIYVNDRFIVSPLMQHLYNNQIAYILAIEQEEVRFFEAHRHAIIPVKINDLVPENIQSVSRLDDPNAKLQHHTLKQQETKYHGHGQGFDDDYLRLQAFLREIDKGLQPIFTNDTTPLILAAGPDIQGLYRKITDYEYISDFSIDLNPNASGPIALHSEVVPFFEKRKEERLSWLDDVYQEGLSKNLADNVVDNAVKHARYKNISDLIVEAGTKPLLSEEVKKWERMMRDAYHSGANIHFIETEDDHTPRVRFTKRAILEPTDT